MLGKVEGRDQSKGPKIGHPGGNEAGHVSHSQRMGAFHSVVASPVRRMKSVATAC